MQPVKPSALKKGDLIGLITPASPVADPSRIERAVRYLEQLGYRTAVGKHVGQTKGYLAGTDEERADDIHAMFADREIRAIMCLRGGYGTPRLLPLLNYRLIARNPKIFVGYSDITVLQLAFWKKCGLISFHGPMPAVDMANGIDPFTEETFWRVLTSRKKLGVLPLDGGPLTALQPGKGSGRLLGGNLSLVVSILGTPYQPDFRGCVLFIEEIEEEPYRVDRMMVQLGNASIGQNSGGIILGQFTDCVPKDPTKPTLSIDEIVAENASIWGRPFLANLPFGHVPKMMTIPVGLRARIDSGAKIVEFLESAVS